MMKSSLQQLEDQVAQIEQTARPTISLLGRAIRYLSYREHSQFGLKKKLIPHAQSEQELDEVITKLIAKGYLSNERFTESFIAMKSQKYGARRIAQELQQHHLEPSMLKEQLNKIKEFEPQKCYELWVKKFAQVSKDPKEIARQVRFLANKGFSQEVIMRIVRGKTPST